MTLETSICSEETIVSIVETARANGKTIVTTNGTFDILHAAHAHILQQAKQEGDVLIVLINSDDSVRALKGENRPIIPQQERAALLAALSCVDYVCVFTGDNPLYLLKKIKPDVHAKGGTFEEERIAAEKELVSQWGGRFTHFSFEKGYSTTNIIDTILTKHKTD